MSTERDEPHTSRRQRQLDELVVLCGSGAVGRAIDLAFEHVAHFGCGAEVLDLLAAAVERPDVPDRLRNRFAELRDGHRQADRA